MTTPLKQLLEQIRDRHDDAPWCTWCDEPGPCKDYEDAVAALAGLTEATDALNWLRVRLQEAERGISFLGDSKSILQQVLATELPELLALLGTPHEQETRDA